MAGHVVESNVVDHQSVRKGDLLLRIDPRDFIARRDQAKAAVAVAEANYRAAMAELPLARDGSRAQIEQGRDNVRLATLVNLLEALGYELVALPKDHLSAIKQIFPESVTAGAVVGTPQISQGKPSTLLHEISVPDPDDDEDEEKPGQIGPAGR